MQLASSSELSDGAAVSVQPYNLTDLLFDSTWLVVRLKPVTDVNFDCSDSESGWNPVVTDAIFDSTSSHFLINFPTQLETLVIHPSAFLIISKPQKYKFEKDRSKIYFQDL